MARVGPLDRMVARSVASSTRSESSPARPSTVASMLVSAMYFAASGFEQSCWAMVGATHAIAETLMPVGEGVDPANWPNIGELGPPLRLTRSAVAPAAVAAPHGALHSGVNVVSVGFHTPNSIESTVGFPLRRRSHWRMPPRPRRRW